MGGEAAAEERKEEETKMDINVDDLDPFSVEDVTDIGNGEPIFSKFAYEDWALLSLRFQCFLLIHSFKKDLNDPDRPSFADKHFSYYYEKYFKQQLSPKDYGCAKVANVLDLVKEAIVTGEDSCFQCPLAEDTALENFVKITEEHRRDRLRRAEAGDETAELKFSKQAQGGQQHQGQRPGQGGNYRPVQSGQQQHRQPQSALRPGVQSSQGVKRPAPSPSAGQPPGKLLRPGTAPWR